MADYSIDADIYYVLNGRRFKSLDSLVTHYNASDSVSFVASIRYVGIEIGTFDIDRLSAEVRRFNR